MRNTIQAVMGAFFTALVAAAFAISFASILYAGDLAVFLDRGIGLTLIGAVLIGIVGAFTLSYKGAILGPQDVPAILLASAAAGIATLPNLTPETVFATVACMIAVTSLITGGLALTLGQFRLAGIARYFPFPVLAGFLATTGLFLFQGGINVALGTDPAATFSDYLAPERALKWGPVVVAALLMLITTRNVSGMFTLPVSLMAMLVGFYLFYFALGMSLDDLAAGGFLLGPFEDGGFLTALDPSLPFNADWWAILTVAPIILTAAASCLIGTTLNASGLELELKADFDIDKEMRGTGFANVVSGVFGGIPGYHVVGESLLASRLGLTGALAGISSAAGCGLILVLGASALSSVPVGFFATVIAFLGVDLLFSWLWNERKRLRFLDYAIVLLIPCVAVSFGFLTAIAVGFVVSSVLFIIDYGQLDLISYESDISSRRSLVERGDREMAILAQTGMSTKIVGLTTFLFFGSAYALRAKIKAILARSPDLQCLILDFSQVHGFDVSTRHVLERIEDDCDTRNIALIFAGLPQKHDPALQSALKKVTVIAQLEDAIEAQENALIAEQRDEWCEGESLLDKVRTLFSDNFSERFFEQRTLAKSALLIDKKDKSRDIYFLVSGRLNVVLSYGNLDETIAARVLPGAVVGEMAYYAGTGRSAAIVAAEASEVLRIDMSLIPTLEQERPDIAATLHKLIAQNMARRLARTTSLVSDLIK